MAIKFPSEEWIKALMQELNKSEAYRGAAKDWEGDFYFIVEPEDGLKEEVIFYMDLWHGECRSAHIVADEKEQKPEYVVGTVLFLCSEEADYLTGQTIVVDGGTFMN